MGRSVGSAAFTPKEYRFIARTDGSQMCVNYPEMWFSENTGEMKEAKRACGTCPFMLGCRLEGLINGNNGVWGGLSHVDRKRMGATEREREINRLQREISASAKKNQVA